MNFYRGMVYLFSAEQLKNSHGILDEHIYLTQKERELCLSPFFTGLPHI